MKRLICAILLLATLVPARGWQRDSSLLRTELAKMEASENFKARTVVATGLLFTAGAVGVNWALYKNNINAPIKEWADRLWDKYGHTHLDDYLQYAPLGTYMVLGATGMGNHSFVEHFAVGATAYLTMGLVVNTLKYTVSSLRPDGSTRNSFPSGHTATAFMGAELLMIEYGGWWGIGAYAVATSVALMRVYNGRHWFSDILGGAAVGALSAHVGYWMLPLERKWFGIKGKKDFVLVPTVGPGCYGIALACEF